MATVIYELGKPKQDNTRKVSIVMAEEAFEKSGLEESCKEGYLVGYVDGFKQGYREEGLRIAKHLLDMGYSCEEVATFFLFISGYRTKKT